MLGNQLGRRALLKRKVVSNSFNEFPVCELRSFLVRNQVQEKEESLVNYSVHVGTTTTTTHRAASS